MKSEKIKLFVYENRKEDTGKLINSNKIYWNGNLKENHSLLKYVEANRYLIRSKYLDFINDLGAKNINDKSLEKISKLKNGHSMWEMSTINEKNIFKSSNIKECLKLLGLILFIKKHKIKELIFCGTNNNVHMSLKVLSLNNKINYKFINLKDKYIREKEGKKLIPYFIRASIFLAHYIVTRFKIIILNKNYSVFKSDKISILSYFVHIKKIKKKEQINLWGSFNKILNFRKKKLNILNDFSPSNDVPDIKTFLKKIDLMTDKDNAYSPLDNYFSLSDILRVKLSYVIVYFKFSLLKNKDKYFFYGRDKINFYYFLKEDFNTSFFGEVLIKNLIYVAIFENLFSNVVKQNFFFFLYENQGWEKALLKSWSKYHNGNLIANINSTIRFWDLRYFHSKKFNFKKNNSPNYILVNGKLSKEIASESNMIDSKKKIVEIEALRYQYMKKNSVKKINNNVIIFGDISVKENFEVCEALNKLGLPYKKKFIFHFKPHPTLNIKYIKKIKKDFPFLKLVDNNVDYNFFNYAICCGTTSAIIESIYYRINSTVYIGSDNLNLCPLPKKIFNNFSYSSNELGIFLNKISRQKYKINHLLNLDTRFTKLNSFLDELKI